MGDKETLARKVWGRILDIQKGTEVELLENDTFYDGRGIAFHVPKGTRGIVISPHHWGDKELIVVSWYKIKVATGITEFILRKRQVKVV